MISDALLVAAQKIDVPKPRRRIRGGMVAGAVALTAVAGAASFAAIRMRKQDSGFAADGQDTTMVRPTEPGLAEEQGPDTGTDGSRIV